MEEKLKLLKEQAELQKQSGADIAMLLREKTSERDLVEVLCSPTSMMTQTAQHPGLVAEIWTKELVPEINGRMKSLPQKWTFYMSS